MTKPKQPKDPMEELKKIILNYHDFGDFHTSSEKIISFVNDNFTSKDKAILKEEVEKVRKWLNVEDEQWRAYSEEQRIREKKRKDKSEDIYKIAVNLLRELDDKLNQLIL